MSTWKTRSRQTICHQPPWLIVELHEVELPDGRVISNWPWVTTPDYINVVVEMEDGAYLCFRQAKYGLPHGTLALVGGYIQPGEAPLLAAQRELREETGCEATEWIDLGRYLVDPNRGIAYGNLFLARRAHRVGEVIVDDLEEQTPVLLSRQELATALQEGQIEVLAWAAAVAFALLKCAPEEK